MDAQQIRLRELASAIATGDAVFFVGAGLSRGAGAPSWDELVTLLRQQLSPASTEPSLSLVAQFYRNQHGEHKLYAELRRLLQQRPLRVTPSHQLLISLPSNVFVTTNYDSLIEDALHGAGRPVHVVADDDELALWNESVEPQVLKVHGDLQRSSTIVFTEEDYLRFLQMNRAIHRKLLDLFSFRTIVFVGYSMRDFDISQVLSQVSHELGSARRPAYLLTFEADAHLWREWERRKVFPMRIPLIEGVDKAGALEHYLRDLREEVSAVRRLDHCDVLIVEDNEDNREILTQALAIQLPEARVQCASDGLEGLMLLGMLRPKVLLADIMMPRLGGWELIELVRRDPDLRDTKIVAVTALTRRGHETEISRYRLEGFIEKPFKRSDVVDLVRKCLL